MSSSLKKKSSLDIHNVSKDFYMQVYQRFPGHEIKKENLEASLRCNMPFSWKEKRMRVGDHVHGAADREEEGKCLERSFP